ncbi:MAG: protein kinase [Thioploca sp.]|nr:protein kinase [Thioploca sp.]
MEEQQHRNTLPKGFWLNEYQIETVLGKPGGFGITYLATDTHLRQLVAIKEYLPSEFAIREGRSTVYVRSSSYEESFQWGLKCFIEEARVLARFNHHSIVRVLRFFEANGTAYMVMEYQQGKCLSDYLKQGGILPEKELLTIILPLLDGLEEIHKAGFLHRDIKPNNIYIREDKMPVLLDFGSARYAVGQKSRSVTSIVTPGYAPLEQYDTELNEQGAWTDIYALGAVMYCLISGEAPPAATRRVRKDPMLPAIKIGEGQYSKNLLQAIDWALKLSGEDRPQSVEQWREKICTDPDAFALGPADKLSPPCWTFLNLASIIIILLLLVTIGILWQQQDHEIQIAVERIRQETTAALGKEQIARQQTEEKLKLVEKRFNLEKQRRKEVEIDYRQAQALIEVARRFEPEILGKQEINFEEFRYYDITNVPENDGFLNIREFPGHLNKIVGKIPKDEKCVEYLGGGQLRFVGKHVWVKVAYKEVAGWVNSYYLMRSDRDCQPKKPVEKNE